MQARLFVPLPLPLLLFTSTAISRIRSGQISGRPIDRPAALIPDPNNRLNNRRSKLDRELTAGSSGAFAFANAPPGEYSIRTAQHCFKHSNNIANMEVNRA